MSRSAWARLRVVGGLTLVAVVVWRLGGGPFLNGLRRVDAWSLAFAVSAGVVTTVSCAWRWRLVARGLGVELPLSRAVAAYYQSQFLNTTLPGGVLGDVHRAVHHGRAAGDLGRGLRAVWWERTAGQAVQVALTVVALLSLASPVRWAMPMVAVVLLVGVPVSLLTGRAVSTRGRTRSVRVVLAAWADVRCGLLAPQAWPGIVLASAVVVTGHAATFLVAARTAGSTAPLEQLLPLALLTLLAMAVPMNVGGWGPREGVAAWAFGAAGLGAGLGVSTAVVYGVMALVASLPGAGVLAASWLRRGSLRTPPAAEVVPGSGGVGALTDR